MPLPGAFSSDVLYILIMSLPLDPAGWPGTPEYQELEEERARRAYHLRLAAMEELSEKTSLRRPSHGH